MATLPSLPALSSVRKAVAAAVGSLLTVLTFAHSLPFIPAQYETLIGVVLGVLTPLATWLIPNRTA